MSLTLDQKLDLIEHSGVVGWKLVYDGCHKIFVLTSHDQESELEAAGYKPADIYPADQVRALWEKSCPLRFVHHWNLEAQGMPWDIAQGAFDYVPTHRSKQDGSEAMLDTTGICLINEDGDQWTDPADQWEPIEKEN